MRLLNTIRYDILFQFRHGFYYAYIFVTVIYVLSLLNIKEGVRSTVTTIVLFTDTAMLGFFFIGAIVLLEKGQNIFEALFVTPLRIIEYLLSKVISLMFISLISALIIVLLTQRNFNNFYLFLIGFVFSTSFYTLFGFIFACYAKSVNDYFAKAVAFGLFMSLPVVDFLNIFKTPLFYFFPTKATFILIDILFVEYHSVEIVYAFCCLSLWLIAASVIAVKVFHKKIILKIGSNV